MRAKLILISFLYLIANKSSCQSYIENSGFEMFTTCPKYLGAINSVLKWHGNEGTVDYFNTCANNSAPDIGIPNNFQGCRESISGKAYTGIALFAMRHNLSIKQNYISNEFIWTRNKSKIIVGKKYRITLNISLSDSSVFFTKYLHIALSGIPPDLNHKAISFKKANYLVINIPKFTENQWSFIAFEFIASESYSYVGIGLFRELFSKSDYNNTLKNNIVSGKEKNILNNDGYCYYYIDNVEISEVK